jgi:putative serine protease PepD
MKSPVVAAALVASACLGGAAAAVAVHEADGSPTTTVITRDASVSGSQVSSTSSTSAVGAIYKAAAPGVVKIVVTTSGSSGSSGFDPFGGGSGGSGQAQGTGFMIDTKGDIVTNDHVVEDATSIKVKLDDGTTANATLVGADPSTDVAVIHVNVPSSELHPLTFADSSAVQVGDPVVAIGDPYGLDDTVTAGIVSAVGRTITSPNNRSISGALQTDAAINSGNSGGPLLNAGGQVIGINSQIESQSGGNIGIGFAVPSNTVKSIAGELISNGKAVHPFLGVELTDASAGGAAVQSVSSGTPAAKAGLQRGDVIVTAGGTDVATADDLIAVIDAKRPGDSLTLSIRRDGSTRSVTVTLGSRS